MSLSLTQKTLVGAILLLGGAFQGARATADSSAKIPPEFEPSVSWLCVNGEPVGLRITIRLPATYILAMPTSNPCAGTKDEEEEEQKPTPDQKDHDPDRSI